MHTGLIKNAYSYNHYISQRVYNTKIFKPEDKDEIECLIIDKINKIIDVINEIEKGE